MSLGVVLCMRVPLLQSYGKRNWPQCAGNTDPHGRLPLRGGRIGRAATGAHSRDLVMLCRHWTLQHDSWSLALSRPRIHFFGNVEERGENVGQAAPVFPLPEGGPSDTVSPLSLLTPASQSHLVLFLA